MEDNLELWEATQQITHINSVIINFFEQQNKFSLDFEILKAKLSLFDKFFKCISSTVEDLSLYCTTVDHLELLKHHRFCKTRSLVYKREESDIDDDSDVEVLVDCFPNIESFKMISYVRALSSAKYITKWKLLRNFDLAEASESWREGCFEQICKRFLEMRMVSVVWKDSKEDAFVDAFSQLHVLEELDLVSFNWKNTSNVLSLPKLKKLRIGGGFTGVNEILENIGRVRGLDVIGLTLLLELEIMPAFSESSKIDNNRRWGRDLASINL